MMRKEYAIAATVILATSVSQASISKIQGPFDTYDSYQVNRLVERRHELEFSVPSSGPCANGERPANEYQQTWVLPSGARAYSYSCAPIVLADANEVRAYRLYQDLGRRQFRFSASTITGIPQDIKVQSEAEVWTWAQPDFTFQLLYLLNLYCDTSNSSECSLKKLKEVAANARFNGSVKGTLIDRKYQDPGVGSGDGGYGVGGGGASYPGDIGGAYHPAPGSVSVPVSGGGGSSYPGDPGQPYSPGTGSNSTPTSGGGGSSYPGDPGSIPGPVGGG